MITFDSNILIYAHRRDSPWHEAAYAALRDAAEGRATWAIPWPCIHEFLAIVSHPRIYAPPSSIAAALAQVDAWLRSPTLTLLSEGPDYWSSLAPSLTEARLSGAAVHDARIAAICIDNGVSELLTADRDFSRFKGLKTRNPLT